MRIGRMGLRAGAALLAILCTGCAVQHQANGKVTIGLDEAQLFGRQIEAFRLRDGSTGALRVLNGVYSVKFDSHAQVVPVGRASTARIVNTAQVGDRLTVLVEKAEQGCAYKYQFITLRGSEVNTWDLTGDCQTVPNVTLGEDGAQRVDFWLRNQVKRFKYVDGRLLRFDIPMSSLVAPDPAPPPATAGTPRTGAKNASSSAAPARATRKSPPPRPSAGIEPSAAPRPVAAPAVAPPVSPKLEFGAQEEKPVRIVLDK